MGAIENIKEVADLVQKMGNIDLYRKIMTLEDEIFQLTRQLRDSILKNEQLEESLKFKGKMEHRPPFFFVAGDKIPYCPNCWEAGKQPVHMINQYGGGKRWDCPKCKLMIIPEADTSEYSSGGSPFSSDAWMG